MILILLIFCVRCIHAVEDNLDVNTQRHSEIPQYPMPNKWNPDQTIDYRLTRLDVELREKAETIQSELRETNRRLQALEWQNGEVHSSFEEMKAEMQRFVQLMQQSLQATYSPTQRENARLEGRIDTLTKGVKIMVAAMRGLNGDIKDIRSNVSRVSNRTEQMFAANRDLLTKQTFNNGLLELRTKSPLTCPHSMPVLPKSCSEVQLSRNESGIYKIQPEHSGKPMMVLCDMATMDGGWTVIQNRLTGVQDFYLNWDDYKHGFGNLGGEFWLGLENIHVLTGHDPNELLIELEDFKSEKAYAHYESFSVGSEMAGYALKVLGAYNGTAGDSLTYHAGSKFSTKDLDQDSWVEGSCAQAHGGGWWYRSCDTSNLNGIYLNGEVPEELLYKGIYWSEFKGAQYSLAKARMLIRSKNVDEYSISTRNNGNVNAYSAISRNNENVGAYSASSRNNENVDAYSASSRNNENVEAHSAISGNNENVVAHSATSGNNENVDAYSATSGYYENVDRYSATARNSGNATLGHH